MSRNIVSSHKLYFGVVSSLKSIFLENETKNPFSRSLKEAPTEDFYVEFDKNILCKLKQSIHYFGT